jgi:magnesium chelatase family protein
MTSHPDQRFASGGLVTVSSAAVAGVKGYPVRVEVHIGPGLPGFNLVGVAGDTCRMTRDRIRAAILTSGFQWPTDRVTVNLAPAGMARPGSGLDLPIAIGILAADGQINRATIENYTFLGELGLDGTLRPVPATVSLTEAATTRVAVVPPASVPEARLVGRPIIQTADNLKALALALNEQGPWPDTPPSPAAEPGDQSAADMADIRGLDAARSALEIAAAGGHNMLFIGPRGSGRTMLARRLPGLLPDLAYRPALEVTRVYSAAGLPLPAGGLIHRPPFRSPHPSASAVSLIGGGSSRILPGELSLAHHGVLFLDDLPEFTPAVLDNLRQPLDDGIIGIARATTRVALPAQFQLVAAMQPCPCGTTDPCRCSDHARARYARRVSGPLLDRFDIRVDLDQPRNELLAVADVESTATVAGRVAAARRRAMERGIRSNAELSAAQLDAAAPLAPNARTLIDQAMRAGRLTGRGLQGVRRVALTVADLRGDAAPLTAEHVAVALALRSPRQRRTAE